LYWKKRKLKGGIMRALSLLVSVLAFILVVVDPALAESAQGVILDSAGLAAIGISLAAFGGASAQAKAISAALESIGRNPGAAGQMFLPWILALVLIESLVIYAFVVALKLVGLI
jgi:F-type H+-transporting ATPase subunit c